MVCTGDEMDWEIVERLFFFFWKTGVAIQAPAFRVETFKPAAHVTSKNAI